MDGSDGRETINLGLDKVISKIISRLESAPKGAVKIEGSWGSFARLLASYAAGTTQRPILYICPHIDDADNSADDLKTFGVQSYVFPAWEGEEDLADATDEIRADRLRLALKLASGSNNFFITTSIQALCQPIPKPKTLQKQSLRLIANETIPPEKIVEWLVGNNFERVDKIDLPGQFAHRGGIIDIFAPLTATKEFSDKEPQSSSSQTAEPLRIEFFGDIIESIREINLDTQLSSRQIKTIDIVSSLSPGAPIQKNAPVDSLSEYLAQISNAFFTSSLVIFLSIVFKILSDKLSTPQVMCLQPDSTNLAIISSFTGLTRQEIAYSIFFSFKICAILIVLSIPRLKVSS